MADVGFSVTFDNSSIKSSGYSDSTLLEKTKRKFAYKNNLCPNNKTKSIRELTFLKIDKQFNSELNLTLIKIKDDHKKLCELCIT